jgi:hypothetical protein
MSTIRDRIVELRRVRAAELKPHPLNWRVHPERQRSALSRVLHEVGYADALVARTLVDGSLELIDGHLRAETTPDVDVPVLVVDLDEREAALLLAVHDPLTELAGRDGEKLEELLTTCGADRTAVDRVVRAVHGEQDVDLRDAAKPVVAPRWDHVFQVVVECDDQRDQRKAFERLTAEGFRCRITTL